MARRAQEFQTLRSEGGLLPSDLLRRVIDPRGSLKGTRPEDYGLPQGERLNEVITQSWNRLRRHWGEFRAAAARLPEGEAGTGLTNDKWSLPLLRELGFGLLPTSASPEIAGRTYAISRFFGSVPIHLVGCGLSLDRRAAGVRGAAGGNPHGLVQEVLNRSPDHLWGIVGNGLRLRILRDNQALSRQSFLEFDREAMFAAEAYSDFVLLWLVAHATRFAPRDGNRIEPCWLAEWTREAQEQGTRALKDLRGSVERALQVLGEGFTSHPKNTALREALRSGTLPLADFHGQLLRVVYRLIFLFVAEDRTLEGQPLLHPRDDSEAARVARERYAAHYGTARLRDLAGKIKGSRHGDLWRQFQILVGALSGEPAFEGTRRTLALPALGSFLWSPGSTADLNGAELTNHDFLEALRHLAFTRQGKVLRPVDYRNLGAEELGGVYESLLALTPQISADGARFTFAEFAGNERKTSGSYYTPDSLVQCLLDSALDPVVEEAIKGKAGAEAEQAILGLKVCDPAVGSGHFLVGAAHRLARHLARVRAQAQGESEPSPLLYQHALRDVIGRCLYGVDLNPMAAELCRVSLWLEALEPGKPLSFLDHHIRVGNSLLGTTPELISSGLPDEAFNPIEGDDKKACTELKKRNRAESKGLGSLFVAEDAERVEALRSAAKAVDEMDDDTPERLARKAESFAEAQKRYDYVAAKRLADAWCAAFVIRKHFPPLAHNPRFTDTQPFGITQGHLADLAQGRDLRAELAAEVDRLARQFQFFHWHLAFPEVFAQGGFDCLLGNPPWDLVTADPSGPKGDELPRVQRMFGVNQYEVLSGRRDLYKLFLVQCGHLVSPRGNLGMLVPLGVFMEDESTDLRVHLFQRGTITDLRHYQNGRKSFFDDVHASYRFCQIVWAPRNDLSHRFWTVA
ncbi:MAG: N-6 DNA methylase, partial [Myxococcales bacterium]|nr:N-6 DNA methylase [Myxococcales bacterium]